MTLAQLLGLLGSLFFLGQALTAMLVYGGSRRSPGVRVNFFCLLTLPGAILPWASRLPQCWATPSWWTCCWVSLLSREPAPSWVCAGPEPWSSPCPHRFSTPGTPISPAPPQQSQPGQGLDPLSLTPFAGTCVGPDRVGMGCSGRCFAVSSSSSDAPRPDLLPGSARAWAKPGPTLGWPACRASTPMLWGLQGCDGWPPLQHWWLSPQGSCGVMSTTSWRTSSQPAWRQEAAADPQLL